MKLFLYLLVGLFACTGRFPHQRLSRPGYRRRRRRERSCFIQFCCEESSAYSSTLRRNRGLCQFLAEEFSSLIWLVFTFLFHFFKLNCLVFKFDHL